MFLRSFPLQRRTLNKSSITSPKFSLVSATTTAMGTRGVMLLGTVQAVSFSADTAHGRFPPHWSVEASRIIALSQGIMELNAGNGIVEARLSEFVMTRLASKASTSGRGL